MLSYGQALIWLLGFSIVFALFGILYSRHHQESLEEYIVARNSQRSTATVISLLATSLGAWILFSPAQAATWGGLGAVIGYAIGSMSPRLAMIPLGHRMRELIPEGHTLTEYIIHRYGKPMYALALVIMMFYLFISLTAEITAMSKLIALIAPIPLWLTAAIVLICSLIYTSYGGLRATIFTDKVQMLVMLPLLFMLIAFGWIAVDGINPTAERLQATAPQLLDLSNSIGIKAGLTFFVAILLTGLFHQGNWQRIYAAHSSKAMRRGFLISSLLTMPFIFVMGLFGLAFVAWYPDGDSSIALFTVLMPALPLWFVVLLIPLGLALVMSSADTAISAVSSLIAIDAKRLFPKLNNMQLMNLARYFVLLLAIPVWYVSAKGLSVLYLFLLADLLCSAMAFPVFYGLYSRRISGTQATLSTIVGLVMGLFLFPTPNGPMDYLLESFLVAALVPAALCLLMERFTPKSQLFDFASFDVIKSIDRR